MFAYLQETGKLDDARAATERTIALLKERRAALIAAAVTGQIDRGGGGMRVTRLKLANLRAIEAAEFRFQPGFNLIVGVNGVGKTSVLDALRVCLSAVVKQVNELRAPVGVLHR